MLISIIAIALVIGLFFLITAIALGGFIYNSKRKNDDLKKKCFKILIPSAAIWVLLIGVNAVLVIIYIANNEGYILDGLDRIIQSLKR